MVEGHILDIGAPNLKTLVLWQHKEITKVLYDLKKFGGVTEKSETKLVLDQRIIAVESLSMFQ